MAYEKRFKAQNYEAKFNLTGQCLHSFVKIGPFGASHVIFKLFLDDKIVDVSGIQIRIVRVEVEHNDRLTTTNLPRWTEVNHCHL